MNGDQIDAKAADSVAFGSRRSSTNSYTRVMTSLRSKAESANHNNEGNND
jgi:hypothetical protein